MSRYGGIALFLVMLFSVTFTITSDINFSDGVYNMAPHNAEREFELIEEPTSLFNPVLARCQTDGSFSLLFRGIKHYDMIVRHFNRAVFLVTIEETKEFRERLVQIIDLSRHFVILLTAEDLVSREKAADIELQISEHLRECYVMFPPGLAIPNSIRSIFTSKSYVTEIQPTIQFTSDEMNIERIGDAFEFNGIILVDMTITEPMPLFFALETKLDRQELEPIVFNDCISGCPALETEIEKNKRIHKILKLTKKNIKIAVRRDNIFDDSFPQFSNVKPTNEIEIEFIDELGYDTGGLLKEWYSLIIREVFSPDRAIFKSLDTNQNAFVPNPSYVDIDHFLFAGRIIGKAIFDNLPIQCHFSRSMYKLMLGRSLALFDLQEVDVESHRSLSWIAANTIKGNFDDQTFTVGMQDKSGRHVDIELVPEGAGIKVTDDNNFHEMIPQKLISSFTVSELERLISGVAEIDVDNWERYTQYEFSKTGYNADSDQIRWFWKAVRSFTPSEQRNLLHFVTGSQSVPFEGFSKLRSGGMLSRFKIVTSYNGLDSIPIAHTCDNQLDLPRYADYDTLRKKVLFAIKEGNGMFLME